jgi:hypothetical protein
MDYVHGAVRWVHGTSSRSTAWGSNLDCWFRDEGLRLDQPKGYSPLKPGPHIQSGTAEIL